MHHVHEVLSVHGDVTFASEHVLDQEVHDLMHLVHGGHSVNDDVASPQIMYLTREFMTSCTMFMKFSVSMVMLHSPQIMNLTREIMTSCT